MGYGPMIKGVRMTGMMSKWVAKRERKSNTHMRRKKNLEQKAPTLIARRKTVKKKYERLLRPESHLVTRDYWHRQERGAKYAPFHWCHGHLVDFFGEKVVTCTEVLNKPTKAASKNTSGNDSDDDFWHSAGRRGYSSRRFV